MSDTPRQHACYICSAHPAWDTRVFHKEAVGLARAGWRVTFIHRGQQSGTLDGVDLVALPKRRRLWRVLLATCTAWRAARVKADIYYVPDCELLPGALLLQGLRGKRVVYDCHEDIVSFIRMKHYLPGPLRRLTAWLVDRLEHRASRKLSGFITADPAMYNAFPALDESRRMIFYNVPLRGLFDAEPVPMADREFDLGFVGTMSMTSGFTDVITMMDRLWSGGRRVSLLLIGAPEGDLGEQMREVARRHKTENLLTISGRVPHTDVPRQVGRARIGLVPLPDVPKFRKNIATKFFEYLAAGCAVMATRLPPIEPFFVPERHGCLVTAGQSDEWAETTLAMLRDTAQLETWSQCGREDFLEKFSAEHEQEKLDRFMTFLIEGPPR